MEVNEATGITGVVPNIKCSDCPTPGVSEGKALVSVDEIVNPEVPH